MVKKKAVEKEIKLTDDQIKRIETIIAHENAMQHAEILHITAQAEIVHNINERKKDWWKEVAGKVESRDKKLVYDTKTKTIRPK
jgi:hypothetical protein